MSDQRHSHFYTWNLVNKLTVRAARLIDQYRVIDFNTNYVKKDSCSTFEIIYWKYPARTLWPIANNLYTLMQQRTRLVSHWRAFRNLNRLVKPDFLVYTRSSSRATTSWRCKRHDKVSNDEERKIAKRLSQRNRERERGLRNKLCRGNILKIIQRCYVSFLQFALRVVRSS